MVNCIKSTKLSDNNNKLPNGVKFLTTKTIEFNELFGVKQMNQHGLSRKAQNLKLSDIFTISQAVEATGAKKRTIYRRIEVGAIKPILLADTFFLDKQTVNNLKKQAAKS